jgi:hypothetical protein
MTQGLLNHRFRRFRLLVIPLIVVGLGYALSMVAASGEQGDMRSAAEAKALDVSNPSEVERWTVGICRGWALRDLAESLGVEPTMEAVVTFLSRDFPSRAKLVVREVCEREVIQTDSS